MNLLIFGASGRTGLPLLEQALAAGHHVVGFVRSPHKINIQHENLTLHQGDVMNRDDVQQAMEQGIDAVLSTLGPVKNSPPDMLPTAADNILAAMTDHQVQRLIWMTGAGVEAPQDDPALINHIIKFALKTFSGNVLQQSELAIAKIRRSDRDWTLVRAPMLTDGDHTRQIRVGWVGVNTGPRLSRADAADFMLRQLHDTSFIGQAPVISN